MDFNKYKNWLQKVYAYQKLCKSLHQVKNFSEYRKIIEKQNEINERIQCEKNIKKKGKSKPQLSSQKPNNYQLNNFVLPPNEGERQKLNLETSNKNLMKRIEEDGNKSRNQFSSSIGKAKTRSTARTIFTSQSSRDSESKFKTLNCIVEKWRVIQEEGKKNIKEYNSNINKVNQLNTLYDFIWKTLDELNSKDTGSIEHHYLSKKLQKKEIEEDTNQAIVEYKLNAMDPKRLVAKLERNRIWKKQVSMLGSQTEELEEFLY